MQTKLKNHMPLLVVLFAGTAATLVYREAQTSPIPEDIRFWNPLGHSPVFVEDNVADFVAWACPGNSITLAFQERDPGANVWERTVFDYSVSYDITHITAREGGRILYVSGVLSAPGGTTDIIEKWSFPKVRGAYIAEMESAQTPVGTPRGPYSGSVSIKDGAYVPHSQRRNAKIQSSGGQANYNWRPEPSKTTVFLGDLGVIDSIAVDPEGRFLLVHSHGSGNLYSIDLMNSGGTPALLHSSSQVPDLEFVRSIGLFDHPSQGRICRMTQTAKSGAPGPTGKTIFLVDAQNDGSFEGIEVHSSTTLAQSPWSSSADWHDPINYGWDWASDFDSH